MKKTLISIMTLSIIFLVGCTNGTDDRETVMVAADWPSYENIDELASSATDVVRAKILSSTIEMISIGNRYFPHIIYAVAILEVFQGDLQVGDEITLKQVAADSDYMIIVGLSEIPIEIGDDLVLFLLTHPNYPHAGLIHQGVYRLSEEIDSLEKIDASIELTGVIEDEDWFEIEITVEDLWNLDEDYN